MKITVSFNYQNSIVVCEFTPAPYIDYKSLYTLDFTVYSANGNVLEHVSKIVSSAYAAKRIMSCRKYHGTLSVTRYYDGLFKTTYRKDY